MFIFQRIQIEVNLESTLLQIQILNLRMIFALIVIMNMMQLNLFATLLIGLHVFELGFFSGFYYNYKNYHKYLQ
jgi:hypothetical protein